MNDRSVQVTFHGLAHSDGLEALIREKAKKLRTILDRLQKIRVVVAMPHRSHAKGNHLELKVELLVPGEEIVITRESELDAEHDSAFTLVREAFAAAQRVAREHADMKEDERRHRTQASSS